MNYIQFTQAQATTVSLLNQIEAKYNSSVLANLFRSAVSTMFNASNFDKLMGNPEKYSAISHSGLSEEEKGQYYVNMAKQLALVTDFNHQVIYKFITRYCADVQELGGKGKGNIDGTAIAIEMLQTPNAWEVSSINTGDGETIVKYINLQSKGLDILDETDENEISVNVIMSNNDYQKKFGTFESMFKNSLVTTNELESMHAM